MAQNPEWLGKVKHTSETKTNPVIRTKTQPLDKIRVNSTKEPGKKQVNIVNLELPMASGRQIVDKNTGEIDETRRASSVGVIAFDIGSMTNKDPKHPGSTEAGTPAMLHTIEDGVNTNAYFDLDLTAIAHKSFDEKQATRKENGLSYSEDTRDPNRDRIDVVQARTTTHNGVAGIAKDGVTKNVAEIASQAYLLSAGSATRDNPDVGAYSKKTVDEISAKFVDTYNSFIKEAVEKGCKGIPAKDSDGKIKTTDGKKQVIIPGTSFDPLKNQGVKLVTTKDGMTALTTDGVQKPDLVAVNKAFNALWSQTVNSTYGKDNKDVKAERTLGNMIGLNSYAVAAYNGDDKLANFGLVQPAIEAKMQPYASSLTKAVNVATHNFQMTVDGKLVEDATPTQAYGEGVINKANEIMQYGSESSGGRTREEAKAVQAKQLGEIYAAATGKDLSSAEMEKDDKQMGE